jgi:molecular chaperone DnaK
VNELSSIFVNGYVEDKSGNIQFEAALEAPPERQVPTEEEAQALERGFQQMVVALPTEKKELVESQFQQAKASYEAALKQEDVGHAVHDFEEMEELVARYTDEEGPLQPPKDFFDKLVKDCLTLQEILAKTGQVRKSEELAQAIEMQRAEGEKAFKDSDRTTYADAIVKLNAIQEHLIMVLRQVINIEDTRSDKEMASDTVRYALEDAEDVYQLAVAARRTDLQAEIALIMNLLRSSVQDIEKNPQAVYQKASQARTRIAQCKNVLMGSLGQSRQGDLVEE